MKSGEEVYSIGFGYFSNIKRPSLYRGYITKMVEDLFIQHTARTYPG
jgi:hypothetical protein